MNTCHLLKLRRIMSLALNLFTCVLTSIVTSMLIFSRGVEKKLTRNKSVDEFNKISKYKPFCVQWKVRRQQANTCQKMVY
jgi:hypothetical protein